MRIYLRTAGNAWAEPTVQNAGEDFPPGFADSFAASVSTTLGVALIAVVAEDDDPDPRTGVLITDPNVTPEPENVTTPQEQAVEAVKAIDPDTFTDPALRDAFILLRDAALGERQPRDFTVITKTEGLNL